MLNFMVLAWGQMHFDNSFILTELQLLLFLTELTTYLALRYNMQSG